MVDDFWIHLSDHVACFSLENVSKSTCSYDHLYTQHAILDSAYNQVQNQYEALQKKHDDLNDLVNILRRALHELEGNQEMLSDQLERVHYGLVMLRGNSNHSDLNPQQRQHVYNVERANLIAARTMGANRFMSTVLQQNRGSGVGEDTDMGDLTREEAESERPLAKDPLGRSHTGPQHIEE